MDRLFGAPGVWSLRRCVDPDCGCHWLDPSPTAEDVGLLYRRYYTHQPARRQGVLRTLYLLGMRGFLASRYGYPSPGAVGLALGSLLGASASRADQIAHSVSYLRYRANGRVLDVGCGEGARLDRLSTLGWSGVGVDLDEAALAAGRTRGLDLRLGTAETLVEPDASFDAITLSHVLEHVPEPIDTLRACHRLLRADGVLSVATPNARSLGAHKFGHLWRGWEIPRHFQILTAPALVRLVEKAGLRVIESRTSARIAATILCESEEPERAGRGDPHSRDVLARSRAFEHHERRALRHDPEVGEELVLLAVR